jgi:hypothetical protein
MADMERSLPALPDALAKPNGVAPKAKTSQLCRPLLVPAAAPLSGDRIGLAYVDFKIQKWFPKRSAPRGGAAERGRVATGNPPSAYANRRVHRQRINSICRPAI